MFEQPNSQLTNESGGSITGGTDGTAVEMDQGGTVVNKSGGTITAVSSDGYGVGYGVYEYEAGQFQNDGTITGGSETVGVEQYEGGELFNDGTITGSTGLEQDGSGSDAYNYGTISGSNVGVIQNGGTLTNNSGGSITGGSSGGAGVFQDVSDTGTVTNSGSISGGGYG